VLQLDIQQIISQAVCFLILWWALKRVAWGPLLALIDARREKIEQDLKHAADAKADIERVKDELRTRLAQIDDEGRTKIQQAVLEGRTVANQIQDEARKQAQAILAKTKETVELELAKAKVSLRNQVADMTLEAVEQLLRRKLDDAGDAQLVEAILDEMERHGTREGA
jgi:F-type H+-transporting ATPase subunit b